MKLDFLHVTLPETDLTVTKDLLDTALRFGLKSPRLKGKIAAQMADPDKGLYTCMPIATALEEGGQAQHAIDYCQIIHQCLLDAHDRDDLVGYVMYNQAKIYARMGNTMSRDLYAIEAANAFNECNMGHHSQSALNLIGPSYHVDVDLRFI